MARSAQMKFRVRPALRTTLEKLAKEDRRTFSAYVEKDHVKSGSQVRRQEPEAASKKCSLDKD
jgi:hypothetical protein